MRRNDTKIETLIACIHKRRKLYGLSSDQSQNQELESFELVNCKRNKKKKEHPEHVLIRDLIVETRN